MAKLKLQVDDGAVVEVQSSVKVIYEVEDDVGPQQLHLKYTGEGRVTDLIDDATGEVVGTKCEEVDDIVDGVP